MIIKPGKFEKFIFCGIVLCLLFAVTLRTEKTDIKASNQKEICEIPIIMYHHITEKESAAGKYTVLTREFENDLKYIKEKGYSTVTVKELIDFTENSATLPEKPIMITFDDGFESFYALAYPLLKEYKMKSVVTVIGSASEESTETNDHNINYSNLTWQQIKELGESKFAEIQNHGYDMHNNSYGSRKGMSKLANESAETYQKILSDDLYRLQETLQSKCGIAPTAVAYPFGAFSKETLDTVKKCGFKCTFTCEEKINTVTKGSPESLYNLGRFNRASGISTEKFFADILI